MTTRRPLVIISGSAQELPSADTILPYLGKSASFSVVVQAGVRAVSAYGDLGIGWYWPGPDLVVDSIIWQFGVADASGSSTMRMTKNAAAALTTGQAGVTAANQADGTSTDAARTFAPTSNNTFTKGDRLGFEMLTVGTTPGRLLIANVEAHWG